MEFIKGHMGGNEIVLLNGNEINTGEELETALKVLDSRCIGGHQAGIIYNYSDGRLPVKIVSVSLRDFLPACGGLTQVLGVALVEGGLAQRYGVPLGPSPLEVTLGFDCGPVPIKIHYKDNKVSKIETDLSSYISECEDGGIETMNIDGIKAHRSGTFLVIDGDAIHKVYGNVDFQVMDEETRKIFTKVQKSFHDQVKTETWNAALFDFHPSNDEPGKVNKADVRVVFPHHLPMGHVETACGTGTIALVLALVKLLGFRPHIEGSIITILCETGGDDVLGGDEITTVKITEESGEIKKVTLSHSKVELIAKGELY